MKKYVTRPFVQCIVLLLSAATAMNANAATQTGGNAARGKTLIEQRGCVGCHTIPGVHNPGSNVGPPLNRIAKRTYIGGVLPNTPENMERWLRDAPAVKPGTAMPNMGITEAEAKDIAAYLYTLD
jgi:cytochrome c2